MNVYKTGKELGYTHYEIKKLIEKEKLYNLVLKCETIEDIKILLMHLIENDNIR